MRPAKSILVVMLGCLSYSCHVGMTARTYRPAQGPQGVLMHVDTAQGSYSGELIEVRDSGIVVLANQKLRLLAYTEIVSSNAEQTPGRYSISNRTAPQSDVKEYLRLLSRFPQGLTPELLQRLLDQNGQTALDAKP